MVKIKSSVKDLKKGLNIVSKAIGNSKIPIYEGLLLEAEGEYIHLLATDLNMGISYIFPLKTEEKGAIAIPKAFINLIKSLEGEVELEIENQILTVKTKNGWYSFNGYDPEEFASFKVEGDKTITLAGKVLKEAILQTSYACGKETDTFLGGLYFKKEDGLDIVATDSHRLAWRKIKGVKGDNFGVILPYAGIQKLSSLLGEEEVKLVIGNNQVEFIIEHLPELIRFYSRVINGYFPDYKQIIPQNNKISALVNVSEFRKVLERISLLFSKSDDFHCVDLLIKDGITITAETSTGKAEEKIGGEIKGEIEKLEISFNLEYLLDLLKGMEGDKITLEFKEPLSPVLAKPEGNEELLAVLMPIKK